MDALFTRNDVFRYKGVPVTQDSHLQEAIKECDKTGSRFLSFVTDGSPSDAPSSYAPAPAKSAQSYNVNTGMSPGSTVGGKFCDDCGAVFAANARFCTGCGAPRK
jgi:hypothetical protein